MRLKDHKNISKHLKVTSYDQTVQMSDSRPLHVIDQTVQMFDWNAPLQVIDQNAQMSENNPPLQVMGQTVLMSEKIPTPKTEVGKNLNSKQVLIP